MSGSFISAPVRGARVLPVLAVLLAAGCGAPTGDVSGRITYNGKPLPSGTVAFIGEKGQVESSLIGGDGNYRIPRAPCGDVRITVQTPPVLKGEFAKMSIPSVEIPERYADPKASGLTYTVKPGPQSFDIPLTGPASPVGKAPNGTRAVDSEVEMKEKHR